MVHSMSRHPTYLYSTYITLCVLSSICTKKILSPMYSQDSSSSAIGAAVCSDTALLPVSLRAKYYAD